MASVEDAPTATTTIQEQASSALETLQRGFYGRIVNGFGVYVDASTRHQDLLEARETSDAAPAVMKTKWPAEAEYGAQETA